MCTDIIDIIGPTSLQRDETPPTSVLDMTLNNLMVML